MNSKSPRFLIAVWLAIVLAGFPALQSKAYAEPADAKPDTAPASPAVAEPAAPVDKVPEADKPAQVQPAPDAGKPEADQAVVEDKKDDKNATAEDADKAPAEPEKPATPGKSHKRLRPITIGGHGRHRSDNERISFGQDSTLAAGEQADAVVSIFGSSTSAGEVSDAVVSVVGSTRVTGGTVGDAVVSVLGSTYINGHVRGEVVTVLGNIELGPDAVVDGEIVCIGGEVRRDAKAVVHGDVQHIAVGGRYFNFDGLTAWLTQCLLYGRPLAFGAHLMWAWCVALVCLGFYALLALMAPGGITKCVETLEERPGKSIVTGVLALVLTPIAYVLLALTIFIAVGVALIPLFSLGLFFAALFGKAVMLTWVGRRVTKVFDANAAVHPVVAVLIGGTIVLGLYTVPVVGFIVYKLLGVLGLGVVIYTLLLSHQNNRATAKAVAAAAKAEADAARAAALPPLMGTPVAAGMPAPDTFTAVAPVASLPVVISASTLERAGFWRRIAATFLDLVMLGIITGMTEGFFRALDFHPGKAFPLWFAVYHVVMWATKSTTIGGIICGLKLVRLDDRPVDWGVAVVRSMSAFLSLAVAGLGFIWVAFDYEKQSWHDKIAGTTIVRVPKGTPLV